MMVIFDDYFIFSELYFEMGIVFNSCVFVYWEIFVWKYIKDSGDYCGF